MTNAIQGRPKEKINWPMLAALRGLLAFTVVMVHYKGIAGLPLPDYFIGPWDGIIAVWLFFIISGFSISHSCSQYAVKQFYWRRFKRLYPAYVVGILLGLWLDSTVTPTIIFGHLLFLQTIVYPPWNANIALWSLPTEVVMYMLAPFITTCVSAKNLKFIIICLCLVNLFFNHWGISFTPHLWGIDILKYGAFWLVGAQFYRIYQKKLPKYFWLYLIIIGKIAAYVAATLTVISIFLFIVSFLIFLTLKKTFPAFPQVSNILNIIGDLSYPLYVCHYPVLLYVNNKHLSFIVSILACIGLAVIIHLAIERPVQWLTKQRKEIANTLMST